MGESPINLSIGPDISSSPKCRIKDHWKVISEIYCFCWLVSHLRGCRTSEQLAVLCWGTFVCWRSGAAGVGISVPRGPSILQVLDILDTLLWKHLIQISCSCPASAELHRGGSRVAAKKTQTYRIRGPRGPEVLNTHFLSVTLHHSSVPCDSDSLCFYWLIFEEEEELVSVTFACKHNPSAFNPTYICTTSIHMHMQARISRCNVQEAHGGFSGSFKGTLAVTQEVNWHLFSRLHSVLWSHNAGL